MVDPFASATNRPSIPPMCTSGTDMIDTEGIGSTSGANAVIRGATMPWVSGTALGVPVVPLVNNTTASSPGAGSVRFAIVPGACDQGSPEPNTGSIPASAATAA